MDLTEKKKPGFWHSSKGFIGNAFGKVKFKGLLGAVVSRIKFEQGGKREVVSGGLFHLFNEYRL